MPEDREVLVRSVGLFQDPVMGVPIMGLRTGDDEFSLCLIWVGEFEANSIALPLNNMWPERPLTHDLMLRLAMAGGATVRKVVITKLEGETFYATICLVKDEDGEQLYLDARPSDAVALQTRAACPLYICQSVLDAQRARIERSKRDFSDFFGPDTEGLPRA